LLEGGNIICLVFDMPGFLGEKINYLWILTRNCGPEMLFSRILIGGLAREPEINLKAEI